MLVAINLVINDYAYGVAGSTQKPEDMYRIIEHFALGCRRLELFGEDHNIRSGWMTVGKGLSSTNFNAEVRYLGSEKLIHLCHWSELQKFTFFPFKNI